MIEFKNIKNLIIIPLFINNKGPFNFVVDTGVGLFLITDPALKDSVNADILRSIKISGFGEGEELTAYVTPALNISIGNNITGIVPAAILTKDAFNLSSYAGIPIHGLIGYEFFSSFIVRINYFTNVLTAYRPEGGYILKKGFRVPITIEERKPYLVSEIAISPGKKAKSKLIIDTGAGHPLSLETDDGKPFNIDEKYIAANLGVGLAGNIKGYLGRINSLKIGRYELKDVISAFPNYDEAAGKALSVNRNGNIGNSVLKHFNVVFDYSRKLMYLRPSLKYNEPFEHDMSGMELVAAGKELDHIMIARIEKGSAADDVGLEEGDEIVAVNFKPVKQMNLQEMDEVFRSRDGRGIVIEVLPKGEKNTDRVILTLKRRI
ncbi:MAG: peptide-binding protein [Sphingobacteriaceae bacterium]|nr:peptide-binding protein [Sphingobacteriaceae bacterium]